MTEKTYGLRVEYTPGGKPVTHGGSGTAYSNYGCRCQECTDANAARYNRRRKEREALAETGKLPEWVKHGSDSTYCNWGCRCEACTKEHSRKCAEYQASVKKNKTEGDG